MIGRAEHDLFRRLVDGAERFVLSTHVNPDGDAIGSQIGLACLLRWLGKEVRLVNQDPTPRSFRFLETPDLAAEVYDAALHDGVFDAAGLLVLVDNSAPDRLGRIETAIRKASDRTLCIDHHPTKSTPWRWNILDDRASATTTLVYLLGRELGWTPDTRAADALHAGLATDTGFFRFNSTRPESHDIAAELLRLGANPARCFEEVYERNAPEYTRLLGQALATLRLDAGGAIATVRITRETIAACGAERVDTSEITTPLLATEGVRIVGLFRELDADRVKVSLRSKGDLDVHELASAFGGGGHRNASGIVMTATLDEAMERVVARAVDLLEAGRS